MSLQLFFNLQFRTFSWFVFSCLFGFNPWTFEGFMDSLSVSWNAAPFCSSTSVISCKVFEYLKVWWLLSFNMFLLIDWLWKSLTMKCLWRKWGTNPDCQYYVGFCELNVFLVTALVTIWYLRSSLICQQHFFKCFRSHFLCIPLYSLFSPGRL